MEKRQVSGYSGGPDRLTVKPSAKPTLVRTQHLPLPAETARELGIPGVAGLLCLVPLCFMMCRCEPLCSSGYGHMADGFRGELAVHRTACFAVRPPVQGPLVVSLPVPEGSRGGLVRPAGGHPYGDQHRRTCSQIPATCCRGGAVYPEKVRLRDAGLHDDTGGGSG